MDISLDQIQALGFLFEKKNGNDLGKFESELIAKTGMSNCNVSEVKKELIKRVSFPTSESHEYRSSAYSSLGKCFDLTITDWWRKQLKEELSRDEGSVYQILIALDNIEEKAFGEDRKESYSILEKELNIRDARAYLTQ